MNAVTKQSKGIPHWANATAGEINEGLHVKFKQYSELTYKAINRFDGFSYRLFINIQTGRKVWIHLERPCFVWQYY